MSSFTNLDTTDNNFRSQQSSQKVASLDSYIPTVSSDLQAHSRGFQPSYSHLNLSALSGPVPPNKSDIRVSGLGLQPSYQNISSAASDTASKRTEYDDDLPDTESSTDARPWQHYVISPCGCRPSHLGHELHYHYQAHCSASQREYEVKIYNAIRDYESYFDWSKTEGRDREIWYQGYQQAYENLIMLDVEADGAGDAVSESARSHLRESVVQAVRNGLKGWDLREEGGG